MCKVGGGSLFEEKLLCYREPPSCCRVYPLGCPLAMFPVCWQHRVGSRGAGVGQSMGLCCKSCCQSRCFKLFVCMNIHYVVSCSQFSQEDFRFLCPGEISRLIDFCQDMFAAIFFSMRVHVLM